MYDRAPRNLHLGVGCTPEHVGPGTYDHRRKKIHEGEDEKNLWKNEFSFVSIEGYAPFLSLANRGDIFLNGENPGPGQYDIRNARTATIKVRFF
jgi:hypothetical protein